MAEYLDYLRRQEAAEAETLNRKQSVPNIRVALTASSDLTAQKVAQSRQWAKDLGLPEEVVMAAPERAEMEVTARALEQSTPLAEWAGQSRGNAAMARAYGPELVKSSKQIEKEMGVFGHFISRQTESANYAIRRNEMWRLADSENWAAVDQMQSDVERLGSKSIPLPDEVEKRWTRGPLEQRQANKEVFGQEGFYGPMAGLFPDMPVTPSVSLPRAAADVGYSLKEGGVTEFAAKATELGVGMLDSVAQPETLAGAGLFAMAGAAEGGIGAIPAGAYGLGAGVFVDNYRLASGRLKMEARGRGVPLDASTRLTIGAASLLLGAIETSQFKVAAAPVKKTTAEAISSTTDLLAGYLREIISRGAYETGTEVGEEFLERASVDAATIVSNALNNTEIDLSTLDDYKNDIYETVKFMLTGGAAVGGAGAMVSIPRDVAAQRRARQAKAAMADATNAEVETLTKNTASVARNSEAMRAAPDAARAVIERIAQDQGVPQTVFIDAEVLETYRQSAFESDGLDWVGFEDGFLEPMGITAEQYQNALDEGVSLELPLAGIPSVVETPVWRSIEASEGVIRAEPQNITNDRIDSVNTIEDPFADVTLTPEVTEETKAGLERRIREEAGRPRDQARAGAEILTRGVERLLKPLGIDPNGWFDEKLSFSRNSVDSGGLSLNQAAAHIPATDSRVEFRSGMQDLAEVPVIQGGTIPAEIKFDEAKEKARQFSQQEIENTDLGQAIKITNRGIAETLRHRPSQADLKALEILPEMLARAQWVRTDPDVSSRKNTAEKVLTLYAPISIDGDMYAARINTKKMPGGDLIYYGHALEKAEGLTGNMAFSEDAQMGRPTASTVNPTGIKIIDLLENVKRKGTRLPTNLTSLYQDSNNPRGWLDVLADDGFRINLTEAADPSTFIHEGGHLFVELSKQVLATSPDKIVDWGTFSQLNDDFQAFAKWAGQDDPYGQWSTEAHEKAARGLETYFMEGKAPVPGLRRIFEQIKSWMVDIYRSLRNLDAPLTPEVRDFFDRLMASDMEIVMDGWRTAEPEGLAPEIQSILEGPRREARQAMEESIRRKRVGEVERMRRQWRKEGAAEADLNPHQRMLADIIKSGGIKLDSLKSVYDKADVAALNQKRPGLVSSNGRIGFDEFADQYGYGASSDAFIQNIKNAPTRGQLINDYVARQEAFYADYLSEAAPITDAEINLWVLEAEAERLKSNVKEAARVLKKVKAALEKKGAASRLKRSINRSTGQKLVDEISRKNMADLKASLKAQAKAAMMGRAAGIEEGKAKGYKRGVVEGYRVGRHKGAAAKRLELGMKYQAEKAARADIQKTRAKWKRFVNQNPASPTAIREGGIEPEFSIQAKQLLNQAGFNIRARGLMEIKGAPSLASFVAAQKLLGNDIFAPDWIINGQWPMNPGGAPKTLGQLTYDQFVDVKNTIESLLHVGRENQNLLAGENRRTFDDAAEAIIDGIQKNLPMRKPDDPGPKSKAVKTASQFRDSLLKAEHIIRDFDGPDTVMGPVWETLFAPIKRAEDMEFTLGGQVAADLQKVWSEFTPKERQAMGSSPTREKLTKMGEKMWLPVPKSWRTTRHTFKGAPHSLTEAEIVSTFANLGNPDNLANLVDGNGFTLESLAEITEYVMSRPKLHQAVMQMVEAINKLYDPLADVHFKATGAKLAKVDPGEITLPNGATVQGWYFPIVRDPDKNNMAYQQGQADTAASTLSSMGYGRRSARSGASHQRVGAIGALSLSLDVINKHVKDTVHDITHRLPVRDVQRILNRDDVRQAIVSRAGLGRYEQLQGWINWVAQPQAPKLDGLWAMADWARRNTVAATLAFNVNTPIMQLMGFSQSIDYVGLKGIAAGVRDMVLSPREISKFVNENSPSVAARDKGFDQDIQEIMKGLDGDAGILANERQKAANAAFWGIKMLDRVVVYATWWGAYDKAIKEGQTKAYAREYADSAVRMTQPLASPKDTAAVQRDPRGKFLAMYYTFFSGFHNRLVERYRGLKHGKFSALDLTSTVFWTVIVPVMLTRLYQQEDIPDDADDLKSLLWDAAAYTVSGVPVVRDVVSAAEGSYRYELSPVGQFGGSVSTTINKWGEALTGAGEFDENLGKSTVRSAGYLFGLPSNQALRTWDGMWKMVDGDTSNPVRLFKPEPKE